MIDILIPTIGRAHKLQAVYDNAHDNTVGPHQVVFIVESDDSRSIAAATDTGALVVYNTGARTYAGAINSGYHATAGDWLFTGNDDFDFKYGWDTLGLAHYEDGKYPVIGVNDNLNPTVLNMTNSTIHLVARWYLDDIGGVIDEGAGSFYHEMYHHNYVETEFIDTAKMRGVFMPCLDAEVHHLHWTAGLSEYDETAALPAKARGAEDAALYSSRNHLWRTT